MIVVKLMGGHSNQLFQYAVGRSLSIKNNTDLLLDLSWFDNMDGVESPRHYELGAYTIHEKFYKPSAISQLKFKLGVIKKYNEQHFNFNPDVLELGANAYLEGYFQTEKYFKDIRPTLLKDLSYKKPPSTKNKDLLVKIQRDPNAVSLHIRRGDYVSSKVHNAFHGVKELEYYHEAIKEIKKTVEKPTLYVISNDPEWCKKNLNFKEKMVIVDNNDDITGGSEDMRLMRTCKHNILANSSFSWWGAWLNENPSKIVIAPKEWFNDKSIDTSDLIPSSWIRL